jgi:hypothetical protein
VSGVGIGVIETITDRNFTPMPSVATLTLAMRTSRRRRQGRAHHMNHNPIWDGVEFLQQPAWTTAVFLLLVVASIGIAVYAFRTVPGQRSLEHVSNWAFRLLIGCMWWQQSLWKLPPFYTDHPDQPFGETGPLIG